MQDLQPYTCVLEDCPSPDELYGSRKDWETHMQKIHSADKWICYVCTQAPQVFDTAAEYETHLLKSATHADTFTEDQLPFLIEDGRTPTMPDFQTCPLCNWSERHAEFDELPSQQSPIHNLKTTNIQDHVAEHLHSFALQALPDLKEADADSLHTSVGSVENNLKNLLASDNTTPSSYEDENQRMNLLWGQLYDAYAPFRETDVASRDNLNRWFDRWGKDIVPPFWTSVLTSHVNDSIWALDSYKIRAMKISLDIVFISLGNLRSEYETAKSAAARTRFRILVTVVQICNVLNRNVRRHQPLPTAAQCQALSDDQCRLILDYRDPKGVRKNSDWEQGFQAELVRLYMQMLNFNEIEDIMKPRWPSSYGTCFCEYEEDADTV
jgi:hypothetical protein